MNEKETYRLDPNVEGGRLESGAHFGKVVVRVG